MTTRHPEYKEALPGYGSYKLSDNEDAKRRRPAKELDDYAQARGLRFVGTLNANGFLGVLPSDSRLQFNVMRGRLPGGAFGILYHEVFAVPYSPGGSDTGGLVSRSYTPKLGLRDTLAFIPGVGGVIDAFAPSVDKRPQALGAPTTVGAALVPEVATLPYMRFGLNDEPPEREFWHRLMGTSFAAALQRYTRRAFWRVEVRRGLLSIRIDGYLYEPQELDELGAAVSDAAAGLAEAAAPLHAPQPFDQPLATTEWPESYIPLNAPEGLPPSAWLPWLRSYVQQRGATVEDPEAYHRAFPRVQVPGRAFAVLRLPIPGTSATGRAVWHNELDIRTHNVGCNGVLLPAAPGAQDTDPVRLEDLPIQYGVRDGIFAVWSLRTWKTQDEGMGDMDGLIAQAVRLGRETGLAAL